MDDTTWNSAPRPGPQYDVFLSYSSSDSVMARRIAHDLMARGLRVFFAEESLAIGDVWEDQIRNALESASAILILISASSLESQWVTVEWSNPLKSNSVRLIPVLISPIVSRKIPPSLRTLQYVDLTRDYEGGLERIVEALPRLQASKAPDPTTVVDMERLVRDVTDQVVARLGIEKQQANHGGTGKDTDDTLVFVITSYAEEMEPIFEGISAAASQVGLRAERVKDVVGDYRITEQIMKMIQSARLVVADLSLERPNVYFELGYARGLGKTVVTIMRAGTEVHFDVKDWPTLRILTPGYLSGSSLSDSNMRFLGRPFRHVTDVVVLRSDPRGCLPDCLPGGVPGPPGPRRRPEPSSSCAPAHLSRHRRRPGPTPRHQEPVASQVPARRARHRHGTPRPEHHHPCPGQLGPTTPPRPGRPQDARPPTPAAIEYRGLAGHHLRRRRGPRRHPPWRGCRTLGMAARGRAARRGAVALRRHVARWSVTSTCDQIAKANSSNATGSRRVIGSSAASS